MDAFRFELTDDEKEYLRRMVRDSISTRLFGDETWQPPEPPTDTLRQKLGAFVTLTLDGRLRGCIGNLAGDKPLYLTIAGMARAAAFEDPRFPPMAQGEFPRIHMEISILSPITPCPDPRQVEVGRHGLIMCQGCRQGLLLPQVPVECRWDRETFLAQTCHKAGLAPDAWTKPETGIYWFEAEVF